MLLTKVNLALLTLPLRVPVLGGRVFINYAYVADAVVVARDYIQAAAYMEPTLANRSCSLAPSRPLNASAAAAGDPPYMVSVWISDVVFNCMFESAHNVGLLRFVLDKAVDGGKFAKYLHTRQVRGKSENTVCEKPCIVWT